MAYSPLPIEIVDLKDLSLDLDNYRIPTTQTSEVEAMEHLFVSEDVMSLMKLILRNGYFDNEIPVAVLATMGPLKGSYTVLEGNRRISALKAMANPASIPSQEKDVRALLKRYAEEAKDLPAAVRVMVAPTREDAEPHIARLHTGLSKRGWTPDQQAKFYFSRLSKTTTVDDIKAMYPGIQIVRYMKMASMRRFVAGAQFTDQSLRDYAVSDGLKMSSLEYAYRTKEFAEALGAYFNKDGLLEPVDKAPQQIGAALRGQELKALEYLLTEFRAGRLNTRSSAFKTGKGFEAERSALLHTFKGTTSTGTGTSNGTKPGGITPAPGIGSGTEPGAGATAGTAGTGTPPPPGGNGPVPRGPNRPNTSVKLDFTGVDYSTLHVNLSYRFYELRTINVVDFPIAASMLMRSVLEATIKAHFESTNVSVSGMLSKVFGEVRAQYGNVPSLKNAINKVSTGKAEVPGTILWFNDPAHNADTTVTGEEVHDAWRLVLPVLRHLLRPAPTVQIP